MSDPLLTTREVGGKLLTAAEFAARLSVKESWVREHTRQGRITHVQLGRYVRYHESEVMVLVDRLTRHGRP